MAKRSPIALIFTLRRGMKKLKNGYRKLANGIM
jgi:hypothetical protein